MSKSLAAKYTKNRIIFFFQRCRHLVQAIIITAWITEKAS